MFFIQIFIKLSMEQPYETDIIGGLRVKVLVFKGVSECDYSTIRLKCFAQIFGEQQQQTYLLPSI